MKDQKKTSDEQKTTLSRQEALRKMGKYAAATAFGTFILLSPKQSQASSGIIGDTGDERSSNDTPSSDREQPSIWDRNPPSSDRERPSIWDRDNSNSGRDSQ